jgi:hypothetical protein
MIRSGYYSSNNFQDSNKRKRTKIKTLGYLPRALFFNAFELGAESVNQVILSDEALRSTVSSRASLTTLGTLEVPEDDSTCKSLLVELKVLPILKNMLRFRHRHLGNVHKFLLFSNKSFILLKLKRREN